MFTPLKLSIIETIASNGKIEFVPFDGWVKYSIKKCYFMGIPHKIIYYVKNDAFATAVHWFDCRLSVLDRAVIVDDITVASLSLLTAKDKKIEKPLIHMALGIVADAAIEFALKYEKKKLVMSAALSGFVDVLLERNFVIKTRNLLNNPTTTTRFRGMKVIPLKGND
jgi:hypothetical protein